MIENPDSLWMVIVGGIIMLAVAFVIGANDVANSFGTSVGSKSLSLPMACILASIFETLGALALGATVASTFENNIIDTKHFIDEQPTLMFGMIASLIGSMVWLFIATHLGMPVSTTHSIIGAIIGFAIASNKTESISWVHLGFIALSWLTSPIISACISSFIFWILRLSIFRHKNSVSRGLKFMWILITFISSVIAAFIVFGNPVSFNFACYQKHEDALILSSPCLLEAWASSNLKYSIPVTLTIAAVISIIANFIIYKRAKISLKKFDLKEKSKDNFVHGSQIFNISTDVGETKPLFNEELKNVSPLSSNSISALQEIAHDSPNESHEFGSMPIVNEKKKKKFSLIKDFSVDEELNKLKIAKEFHDRGEKFEPRTEAFSGAVQIFSACFASLAHGANDVSNAVGPFVTILSVYRFGLLDKTATPHWVLFLSGLFISLGLALYGYKVIRTIGISMIHMTPCRGVCIETATAFTVVVFSKLGVPLSTTYCQVGSVIGVGLIEPKSHTENSTNWLLGKPVNYKLFLEIFVAWILTIFCSGIVTSIVFLFGKWVIPF